MVRHSAISIPDLLLRRDFGHSRPLTALGTAGWDASNGRVRNGAVRLCHSQQASHGQEGRERWRAEKGARWLKQGEYREGLGLGLGTGRDCLRGAWASPLQLPIVPKCGHWSLPPIAVLLPPVLSLAGHVLLLLHPTPVSDTLVDNLSILRPIAV